MNKNIAEFFVPLNAFIVVCETLSFTDAASHLGCSRAYVSKLITSLEKQLGVTLLHRTTRTLRLTRQGEELFSQCRPSLDSIAQSLESVSQSSDELNGHIRINSIGGLLGESIVESVVTEFLIKNPEVTIDLDFSSRKINLIKNDVDMVFRVGALDDSRLIARKLANLKTGTYCSPDYKRDLGVVSAPSELKKANCLTGSFDTWFYRASNDNYNTQSITHRHGIKYRNGKSLMNAACSGLGVISVMTIIASEALKSGRLVKVLEGWENLPCEFYLVYKSDKNRTKTERAFIEFVIEHFSASLSKYL
ncbi:LysR substrate-binding domain-containing protein [Vibrio splendidus]|jgi:DNA-binding transcriptional LysR family regulator|uniref:LysR substrate-binding domain-containing protein n=1 Tax=Vibrio splendidus TaxID=29497 RepID=UPI000C855F33|nr:LysR family transcriptional regulator [Vibrio splendidus]MCQ8866989.1 LysR substrate-binding domain-containing protein [Vibrio splendidus]PMK09670.1 hypothetical protein BCU08_10330 [Vibrio splendidus]PTP88198.1 LysR family transcriptional regulator [Vibrio splendidus]